MRWRDELPAWVLTKDDRFPMGVHDPIAAVRKDIAEAKADIDLLRLLSGLSIFLGILAIAAAVLAWGMR